jgi:hypothetical protein
MLRAVVSKRVLDKMIREKMRQVTECGGVEALPVVWRERLGVECNWEMPGWQGGQGPVRRCSQRILPYLAFLGEQFDIPDEVSG